MRNTKRINGEEILVMPEKDRDFYGRMVMPGEKYGRKDCLVNDKPQPLVEVWDASQDPDKFGPLGQFVARYYLSTIMQHPDGVGLDLLTYVEAWKLSGASVDALKVWAEDLAVTGREK